MRLVMSFTLIPLMAGETRWWTLPICIWISCRRGVMSPALITIWVTGCGITIGMAWQAWWMREGVLWWLSPRSLHAGARMSEFDDVIPCLLSLRRYGHRLQL